MERKASAFIPFRSIGVGHNSLSLYKQLKSKDTGDQRSGGDHADKASAKVGGSALVARRAAVVGVAVVVAGAAAAVGGVGAGGASTVINEGLEVGVASEGEVFGGVPAGAWLLAGSLDELDLRATVENTIFGVGNDADETLLVDPLLRDGDLGLAELAEAALLDNGVELGPVGGAGEVGGSAEEPIGLGVGASGRDGVAADVEVGDGAGVEVDLGTAAGTAGQAVLAAGLDRGGVVNAEVGGGRGGEEGKNGGGEAGHGCWFLGGEGGVGERRGRELFFLSGRAAKVLVHTE